MCIYLKLLGDIMEEYCILDSATLAFSLAFANLINIMETFTTLKTF